VVYEARQPRSLAKALARFGGAVSLPPTRAAGTVSRVSLFSSSPPGEPEDLQLDISYSSGVILSVGHGANELTVFRAKGFKDGRTTSNTLRIIDGVPVLVTEPGERKGRHGYYSVPATLYWNSRGLQYRMVAGDETPSARPLISLMRAMQATR